MLKTSPTYSQITMVTCIIPRLATTVRHFRRYFCIFAFPNSILDPSPNSLVVHLNVSFPAPAVILDHSSFVANVSFNGNNITITFTTLTGFQYAQTNWKSFSELILVTTAVSTDGQREYFLVTSPAWNSALLNVTYAAKPLSASYCFGEFTVNWGTPGHPGSPPINTHPGSPGDHNHGPPPENSGSSTKTTMKTMIATTTQSHGSSTPASTVCSKPSSPIIDGLPAVPCGYYFDKTLDQDIGFYSFSGPQGAQALSSFAPGVVGVVPSDLYVPTKKKRSLQVLQKRSFGSWLRSVAHVRTTFSFGLYPC
jgi:hypothetical protein